MGVDGSLRVGDRDPDPDGLGSIVRAGTPAAIAAAMALSTGLGACGSGGASSDEPATRPAATTAATAVPVGTSPALARRVARICRPTPGAVIKRYLPAARARGADRTLLRIATDPPKRVTRGPGYALLAGAVYANSLPVKERVGVAPVCAKELMSKKSMSNEGTSR